MDKTRRDRQGVTNCDVAPMSDDAPITDQDLEVARRVNAVVGSIEDQQRSFGRLLGRIEALDAVRQYTTAGWLLQVDAIRKTKAYKGMQLTVLGAARTIKTFSEFCDAIGVSQRKIEEDLQNLNIFGERFLDRAQAAGIGYRQLRALRKLPDEARQVVIEGERLSDDPESLKDLLEDVIARNAKREEGLKKELDSAKQTIAAKDKVLAEKAKQLTDTQFQLERVRSLAKDDAALLRAEAEGEALKKLYQLHIETMGRFAAFLVQLRAVTEAEEVAPATMDTASAITSEMCQAIANSLTAAGVDIDFRRLVYPPELFGTDHPQLQDDEIQ